MFALSIAKKCEILAAFMAKQNKQSRLSRHDEASKLYAVILCFLS